jgi:D-3-phosphoglycerate dehydrogenase / 2-oxoglutarate reductase
MRVLFTTSTFNADIIPREWDTLFNPYHRKLSEDEVIRLIEEFDPVAIIAGIEPLTKEVLSKAKSLRIISRCGSGLDSVDQIEANKKGIKLLSTPDAATISVGELTIGLVLEMLRKIRISDNSIRNSGWVRPMGNLLNGKTIGIIGCGRIGSYVAKLLKGFGCNVIGYDSFLKKHPIITLKPLDEVLVESDIVSLHLPYYSETHHIIGKNEFLLMKKGSFIVNASRGGLIEEESLYNSIINSHLAGAALDCFESEPYKGVLTTLDNVVLSAHIGSYAIEARKLMEIQAIENLIKAYEE